MVFSTFESAWLGQRGTTAACSLHSKSDESKCLDSAMDASERETDVWPKTGPEEPTTAERSWHGRSAVSSSRLVQELRGRKRYPRQTPQSKEERGMKHSKHCGAESQVDHFSSRSGPDAPLSAWMSAVGCVWSGSLAVALQGKGRKDKCAGQDSGRLFIADSLERAFLSTQQLTLSYAVCEKLTPSVLRESPANRKSIAG